MTTSTGNPTKVGDGDSRRRYALVLTTLLTLFVLRVVAQALIALGFGSFLPPWQEWFSGLVPYPQLLASQLAIVIAFGKICVDFWRGRGYFAEPRRWAGMPMRTIGMVYLAVMIIRYSIRMSLYPLERWSGGAIPIFFHWVLAAFMLVFSRYHQRNLDPPPQRSTAARAALVSSWVLIVAGIGLWTVYQLAPTVLAAALGARSAEYAVRIDRGAEMVTSDGITLRADVYHPQRADRTPTILVRIPFSKTLTTSLFATIVGRFWAERGYTVIVQGTRGRYESGGRHIPLVDERRDGIETLSWLRNQPWFDGRLGMWGGSAFGYTQWAIADHLPSAPSGASALMIQICSTDFYRMFHPGGAFSLASALFWAVRSRGTEDVWPRDETLQQGFNALRTIEADDRAVGTVPFFDDWVIHSARDDYWLSIDGTNRAETVRAPVHLMAGWFDPFLPGQLDDFTRIKNNAPDVVARATRLVIGPWGHAESVTLPGNVRPRNYRLESLAPSIPWFDRHLRPDIQGGAPQAPVRLFVMGINQWRDEQDWPLARAIETSWYLRGNGRANTSAGDGQLVLTAPNHDEPPDVFESDPARPVPTTGGAMLGQSAVVPQNEVEMRHDVLVYTTDALDRDLEVTGPVSAILFVEASTVSADVVVKLVDVHPTGVAYNVSDGIRRGTFEPHASPGSGMPTPVVVDLWPTSMVFRRGHRIRIEIAGSNYPRFDRNLHSSESAAQVGTTATQAIHHGQRALSRLVLPHVAGRRDAT